MKVSIIPFLSIVLLLASCHGQATIQKKSNEPIGNVSSMGDTVANLGSSIMVVHQDKKSNYWFGSWQTGVYRYDGTTLTHYTTAHGLPNNRIDAISEDQSGNIYFTSCHPESTIVKYDGNTFTTLTAVPSNDWQLQSTDMWFKHAYRNEKVYRYDGTTLHELKLPKPSHLSNPFEIYSIYTDSRANVWFGTNPVGVCRYDGKSFDWITEEDVTEFRNEGANGVRSVVEDSNGDFWFNTEYRYSVYDSSTVNSSRFYTRHESIGSLDGMEDGGLDEYLSAVRDDDDNLWFVTYLDGVWQYDGKQIIHHEVMDNAEQIALFSIYKDHKGDLWLGTHENGAYKFNGQSFEKFVN